MNKILSARHTVLFCSLALVGLTVAYLVNKNFPNGIPEVIASFITKLL